MIEETKDTTAIRFEMVNGCSSWIRARTRHNMTKILLFLQEQSEGKKRKPDFTYSAIGREIGIDHKQVQFACQKMAFKEDPIIKIFTTTSGKGGKLRLHEKVIIRNTE